MSKEAMKLALEALDNLMYWDNGKSDYDQARQAIAALQEALAKPDFWEGYVPEPDSTCSNALRIQHKAYPRTCKKCGLGPCVELAQQALDKKAENARELGLDYEPAQQEPVAWVCNGTNGHHDIDFFEEDVDSISVGTQLYTSPPQRKPLTDEEIAKEFYKFEAAGAWYQFARAIEAKLKEKNT